MDQPKIKNCLRSVVPEPQTKADSIAGATVSAIDRRTAPGKISQFLLHGQQNAVPLKYLEALTGLDNRSVRKAIERERRSGIPILSDNRNGYYLPANQDEKERFIRSMQHRAREIIRTTQAIEKGGIYIGSETNVQSKGC